MKKIKKFLNDVFDMILLLLAFAQFIVGFLFSLFTFNPNRLANIGAHYLSRFLLLVYIAMGSLCVGTFLVLFVYFKRKED